MQLVDNNAISGKNVEFIRIFNQPASMGGGGLMVVITPLPQESKK
jgi:hypothetical protein